MSFMDIERINEISNGNIEEESRSDPNWPAHNTPSVFTSQLQPPNTDLGTPPPLSQSPPHPTPSYLPGSPKEGRQKRGHVESVEVKYYYVERIAMAADEGDVNLWMALRADRGTRRWKTKKTDCAKSDSSALRITGRSLDFRTFQYSLVKTLTWQRETNARDTGGRFF